MRRTAIIVLLLVGAIGCDPGWSYRPTQSGSVRTGDYEIDGASAHMFAGFLEVRFTLRNVGLTPLSVDPARFRVVDARGHDLPSRLAAPASPTEHVVYKVLRGTSLDLDGAFQAEPGHWPFFNRDLRTITITVDVTGRGGAQVLQTSLDRT
jgi:hypothetical protein